MLYLKINSLELQLHRTFVIKYAIVCCANHFLLKLMTVTSLLLSNNEPHRWVTGLYVLLIEHWNNS